MLIKTLVLIRTLLVSCNLDLLKPASCRNFDDLNNFHDLNPRTPPNHYSLFLFFFWLCNSSKLFWALFHSACSFSKKVNCLKSLHPIVPTIINSCKWVCTLVGSCQPRVAKPAIMQRKETTHYAISHVSCYSIFKREEFPYREPEKILFNHRIGDFEFNH